MSGSARTLTRLAAALAALGLLALSGARVWHGHLHADADGRGDCAVCVAAHAGASGAPEGVTASIAPAAGAYLAHPAPRTCAWRRPGIARARGPPAIG
jgi:hypothetical protein